MGLFFVYFAAYEKTRLRELSERHSRYADLVEKYLESCRRSASAGEATFLPPAHVRLVLYEESIAGYRARPRLWRARWRARRNCCPNSLPGGRPQRKYAGRRQGSVRARTAQVLSARHLGIGGDCTLSGATRKTVTAPRYVAITPPMNPESIDKANLAIGIPFHSSKISCDQSPVPSYRRKCEHAGLWRPFCDGKS